MLSASRKRKTDVEVVKIIEFLISFKNVYKLSESSWNLRIVKLFSITGIDFDVDSFLYSLTIHCCHLPGNFGKNIKEQFLFFFPDYHIKIASVLKKPSLIRGCCTVQVFCRWLLYSTWFLSLEVLHLMGILALWHAFF